MPDFIGKDKNQNVNLLIGFNPNPGRERISYEQVIFGREDFVNDKPDFQSVFSVMWKVISSQPV